MRDVKALMSVHDGDVQLAAMSQVPMPFLQERNRLVVSACRTGIITLSQLACQHKGLFSRHRELKQDAARIAGSLHLSSATDLAIRTAL